MGSDGEEAFGEDRRQGQTSSTREYSVTHGGAGAPERIGPSPSPIFDPRQHLQRQQQQQQQALPPPRPSPVVPGSRLYQPGQPMSPSLRPQYQPGASSSVVAPAVLKYGVSAKKQEATSLDIPPEVLEQLSRPKTLAPSPQPAAAGPLGPKVVVRRRHQDSMFVQKKKPATPKPKP